MSRAVPAPEASSPEAASPEAASAEASPDPSGRLPVSWPRETPLVEGRLVRRYKRFLADVELASGEVVVAHSANTGAMEGLTEPGLRVWLSRAENPNRKLAWDWELVERGGRIYGAHTGLPNKLVKTLLEECRLPWICEAFDELAPERRYGERSRVDFWVRRGERETFVEVKNCHLVYPDDHAYFPDSVSARATHHLEELEAQVSAGHRAEVLFVCQTGPVAALRPSDLHDPEFAAAARKASAAGVGFSALVVSHTPEEITIEARVPVDLDPYDMAPLEGFRAALKGKAKGGQVKGRK